MQNVISIKEWQERKFERLAKVAMAGMTKAQINRAIRDLGGGCPTLLGK